MAPTATGLPRLGLCIPRRNSALMESGDMEIERLPLGQSLADKHRAPTLKWRGKPPGIPPEMAVEFMAKLKAGSTIRKLVEGGKDLEPNLVSRDRFKKHCEMHPEWAAEARRISKVNGDAGKGARLRNSTHCLNGHPFSGENLYGKERKCITCMKLRYESPVPATAEQIQQVTAALNAGKTISQICWGRKDGRIIETPILSLRKLKLHRRLNPDFERFVLSATHDNNGRGQRRRYQPERVRIQIVRDQNADFQKIVDMTPAYLPPDVRNDTAQSIFVALFEGSPQRNQVKGRVQRFVADHNRLFPTKYAKFGKSALVSLDEVMFEDGSTTRGDNVSRGLWD
jgi:hypothetical protein